MRDKNGRYAKKPQNIIIYIPSLASLIKFCIMLFIFSPWIYIFIFRFDIMSVIEGTLSYLFGPKIITESQECKGKETPYKKNFK